MQIEDIKIIQTTRVIAAATDKLVVAKMANRTPQAITVADLLKAAVNALPSADPVVAGELWLNAGVLSVSVGA